MERGERDWPSLRHQRRRREFQLELVLRKYAPMDLTTSKELCTVLPTGWITSGMTGPIRKRKRTSEKDERQDYLYKKKVQYISLLL